MRSGLPGMVPVHAELPCLLALQVAALARENEALKARLTGLLTSPANDELQLPTRLLLQ